MRLASGHSGYIWPNCDILFLVTVAISERFRGVCLSECGQSGDLMNDVWFYSYYAVFHDIFGGHM